MRRLILFLMVAFLLLMPVAMPFIPTAGAAGGGEHRMSFPLLNKERSGMEMTTLRWLSIVNQVRREASVFTEPLNVWEEEPRYTRGSWFHARYVVLLDFPAHFELPGPLTTEEGANTAEHSILLATSYPIRSVERVIYSWLSAPFHGSYLFSDGIGRVGYGDFYSPQGLYHFAAVMDVWSEFYDNSNIWTLYGRAQPTFDAWPGPGTVVPYRAFAGGEYPNPITVCPGYRYPVGTPIYVFTSVTDGERPELDSFRVTDSRGREVEVCEVSILDWTGDTWTDRLARDVMFYMKVNFLIPKHPLRRGETYHVDVVAWDWWRTKKRHYSWDFRVADDAIFDPLLPDEQTAYDVIRRGAVSEVRAMEVWNRNR